MKRRVVVTGLGAVTPIGNNVETFWNGIKEGKVGIGPITKFDTAEYKVKIAAEVKGFLAKEHMDFKAAKRMELFSQYAVAAAKFTLNRSTVSAISFFPKLCFFMTSDRVFTGYRIRISHSFPISLSFCL